MAKTLYFPGRTLVPTGGLVDPELVWMVTEKRKSLASARIQTPIQPTA
jgi:hypothetical protein